MKITTVTYSRTYPTGLYANEKIGMEATVDEGDDVGVVLSILKANCDEINKKNNPQLYTETIVTPTITQEPEEKLTPEEMEKNTIDGINRCTTIKELKDWELIAKSKWNTRSAYMQKLKQLTENQ